MFREMKNINCRSYHCATRNGQMKLDTIQNKINYKSQLKLIIPTALSWLRHIVFFLQNLHSNISPIENLELCLQLFALVSEVKALMQSRGFVVTRLFERTDTPTTDDPEGNPETGSSSTRTQSCRIINEHRTKLWHKIAWKIYVPKGHNYTNPFTSGDFKSTMASETTPFTAAATMLKHLSRPRITLTPELSSKVFFISVSSIPLLLYPIANYNKDINKCWKYDEKKEK